MISIRFDTDLPEIDESPFVTPNGRSEDPSALPGATEISNREYPITGQQIGFLRWVIGELLAKGKQHVKIAGRTYGVGYLRRLLDVAPSVENSIRDAA